MFHGILFTIDQVHLIDTHDALEDDVWLGRGLTPNRLTPAF